MNNIVAEIGMKIVYMSRSLLALILFVAGWTASNGFAGGVPVELTKGQAMAQVRSILKNSTHGCRINRINSVVAVRVNAGWRVTAMVVMSASGRRITERAVWIVSQRNGAVAQDQLTSEIANRCNN
jgi:hypothetical protein